MCVRVCLFVFVCVCLIVRVYLRAFVVCKCVREYVFVCEREKERERKKESTCVYVCELQQPSATNQLYCVQHLIHLHLYTYLDGWTYVRK